MSPAPIHVPALLACAERWLENGSEIVAASEPAPISTSSVAPIATTSATRASRPRRVSRAIADAARNPAGSQAANRRSSGWSSSLASCCRGSAPFTRGPAPSRPALRNEYIKPIAESTQTKVNRRLTPAAGSR